MPGPGIQQDPTSMPAAAVTNLGSFVFYTGMVAFTLASGAPPGWVMLSTGGSTAPIADYPNLAALLGTRYGGDGVTTFGLPPAEYVLAGPSPAHGLWSLYGEETHTLTDGELAAHDHNMPSHSHAIGNDDTGGSAGYYHPSSNPPIDQGEPNVWFATEPAGGGPTDSAGGGAAHNNLQPTHRVNVIVKT